MKGIAHFVAGVAAAACFPAAVQAGLEGNGLYFVLGGVAGLLPDTLDFKFVRYFWKHDIEVTPDPNRPDPRQIADAVALAVNRAHETGKPVAIKLNTVRLGADQWQRYEIKFDVAGRRVVASYGPAVDTGGNPIPGARPPAVGGATAPLVCDLQLDYLASTSVDIFDGPLFRMNPKPGGRVMAHFIPWHRQWTHSLTLALLGGVAAWAAWNLTAGLVVMVASLAHALLDQLGFMGSNLFYPLQKDRIPGLKLMHSSSSLANFTAVWTSILLIFGCLMRQAPAGPRINPLALGFYGLILPALVVWGYNRLLARSRARVLAATGRSSKGDETYRPEEEAE